MKVVFISNFLNHHQYPFCAEMVKNLGDSFYFISTMDTPLSFLNSGYPDFRKEKFNYLFYNNVYDYDYIQTLINKVDVVIIGDADFSLVKDRLRMGKLIFRYSERWFKKGILKVLINPRNIFNIYSNHYKYREYNNLYMLCASAFLSNDLSLMKCYPQRCIKWGYFTELDYGFDVNSKILNTSKHHVKFVWVGRFIKWKHPDKMIYLALKLKEIGINFTINMIGTGIMFDDIKKLIYVHELQDQIKLLSNIPNSEVCSLMKESDIFISTSDKNEGWGAVLNEAMSAGCAVVVSDQIGAAPYLIKNGWNGLLYDNNSQEDLVNKVKEICEDLVKRIFIMRNARGYMLESWNAQVAANRFLNFASDLILTGSPKFYEEGPMSEALPIIK